MSNSFNARAPVFGSRGMVVSGHPSASLAGWKMLEAGGSVADAAVAAASMLAVVLPQACTLGGDAFILIHDAVKGTTVGLNASGPAPAALRAETFAGGIPRDGPLAATVPGVVAGWHEMQRRFGRLPWKEVLAPAIAAAEQGFPASAALARAAADYRSLLESDPASASLFLPAGSPLAAGQVLRQPQLAVTLREIATDGADAFYRGRPAASIARACNARGGLLQDADFHRYRPEWVEPLATSYRDLRVGAMPPNSFGLLMLLQLNVLEDFDLAALPVGSAARCALLMSAARAAFAQGRRAIADPAAGSLPVTEVLSPEATRRMREAARRALTGPLAANQGGTAVVSAADAAGNGVTLVQSIFLLFGSGVTDPESGVLLNNRMTGFTTEPGHPNQVAPGKRPAHTLSPAMAFQDGRLRFLLGTPGGPGQTLTLTQVLSNVVDLKMDLAAAVEAPRWSMNLAGEAILEASAAEQTLAELRRLGSPAQRAPSGSPFFGSAEVIEILPNGVLCGAADSRREALAVGA
ncbi:MAG: gamma-glutamyltransferase [Acidobacteria bacterium]|nr:gamma-glutamyltransferase [Acidobacteriota bacterium]